MLEYFGGKQIHCKKLKCSQDETYFKDKNVRWLKKTFENLNELSAISLQPPTDKNELQIDKIYARRGEMKTIKTTKANYQHEN